MSNLAPEVVILKNSLQSIALPAAYNWSMLNDEHKKMFHEVYSYAEKGTLAVFIGRAKKTWEQYPLMYVVVHCTNEDLIDESVS